MSVDKSIQIQILKTDYKKMNRYSHFKMEYVTKDNFSEYVDDLKQVITYIHKELTDWPEAPDYTEVLKRFEGELQLMENTKSPINIVLPEYMMLRTCKHHELSLSY